MRFALPACSAAVVLGVCSFAGSQAATVSYSISTGAFNTQGIGSGGSNIVVPGFDSSLGTLTEITASLSGTYTDTVFPPTAPDQASFLLDAHSAQFFSVSEPDDYTSGTVNFSASGSVTDATDLALFTSSGSPALSFGASDIGPSSISSTGFTGTLTYTYTPAAVAAATPEPSSLVLLGTGVLGAAGVVRRRVRT